MFDETVIVRGQGTIFLAWPPLVRAATGEVISAEELGGAETHGRKSGVVDHVAESDGHALQIVRDIVAALNRLNTVDIDIAMRRPPRLDPAEIYGIVPQDVRAPYDVHEVIAGWSMPRSCSRSSRFTAPRLSAAPRVSGACWLPRSPITACCFRKAR